MATTKKEMIIIAKYTVKRNGAVIYRMRSNVPNKIGCIEGCDQVERDGKFYDVYMVTSDGEYVCGCETSGEMCRGSKYRGTCCHRKYVQMLLDLASAARNAVMPVVETPVEVVAVEEVAEVAVEPVVEAVVAEAPKPTYRIVSLGTKKERYDLLAEIEAKREHKSDMLGEINAIKARKRSEDISQRGNLNGASQTSQMPAWLAILPSRQVATRA